MTFTDIIICLIIGVVLYVIKVAIFGIYSETHLDMLFEQDLKDGNLTSEEIDDYRAHQKERDREKGFFEL